MTQKEAYTEGFCKAAEAHGVDPEQLMKVAKRLGGPDPAPGMLGASQAASKEGFLERLFNKMPTGAISFTPGKGGLHAVTHGDMKKLTEGMTPLQRALAYMNPTMLNFRKVAEEHGVDPNELIKVAVPLRELLEVAKSTGKVNSRLAMALTNIGRVPRRHLRLPDKLVDMPKALARRTSGAARAQTAVGNFYRENGIPQLVAKNPASKPQRFWANQLTHPDMTAPTGLEWGRGEIFSSGIEPGMHVADIRRYLTGSL